jgi:hypothetical protein
MRVRTIATLTTGAVLGAGATYLADRDRGRDRRRAAGRWVVAQGRQQAVAVAATTLAATREMAAAAATGFRETALPDGDA